MTSLNPSFHRAYAIDAQGRRTPLDAVKLIFDLGGNVEAEIDLSNRNGTSFSVHVPATIDSLTGKLANCPCLLVMPQASNGLTIFVKSYAGDEVYVAP